MVLQDLSLKDLHIMASQNFGELVSSQQIVQQKRGRTSREDIVLLHDSALGFAEVADFMLGRARKLNENRATLSPIERDLVNYVLSTTQPVLETSKKLAAALRKRYDYLGGSNPK